MLYAQVVQNHKYYYLIISILNITHLLE